MQAVATPHEASEEAHAKQVHRRENRGLVNSVIERNSVRAYPVNKLVNVCTTFRVDTRDSA